MHQSVGYAVGNPDPLVWTVSLTAKEAQDKYLKHCRADGRKVKDFEETGAALVHVLVTSYDPSTTLEATHLDAFLRGYRRGIKDSQEVD